MNENPDMKYVIPEEGSNKWVDALCIPKDAPNKASAEAFINFLCNPENAKENVDYIGYSTPNTAAYDLLMKKLKITLLHIHLNPTPCTRPSTVI